MKKTGLIIFLLCSSLILNAQNKELPKGWWQIPNSGVEMKIGGYVKLDMIHDFDPIGSPYFFNTNTIPTDGSKGQATNFNARESRLVLDFNVPKAKIKTKIEGDFYGVNGAFRLRHAYVEFNNRWLAGQTWSNFMDENMIPGTLDFEKPLAYVFARHAMLRYKQPLNENSYIAFALEQPSAKGQAPAQAGKFESPFPDLTARYRLTKKWGHVQLSGYLANVRYRFNAGGSDDLTQAGAALSGQFNVFEKDKFIYQAMYGSGITRYRGGNSVGLDANGKIKNLTEAAFLVGFEHFWTNKLSSLAVFNYGRIGNTAGQPTTDLDKTYYGSINLLYHVIPGTFAGVEYLTGKRTDSNGAN